MVIHPSYYDACDVSCDVIYYVIAVRARRMVRIFFLPYFGNRSKSDPYLHELFCLESRILSFPKVLQIPPESPCMYKDNEFIIKKKDHKVFAIEMLCNTLICACVYSGLSPPE